MAEYNSHELEEVLNAFKKVDNFCCKFDECKDCPLHGRCSKYMKHGLAFMIYDLKLELQKKIDELELAEEQAEQENKN